MLPMPMGSIRLQASNVYAQGMPNPGRFPSTAIQSGQLASAAVPSVSTTAFVPQSAQLSAAASSAAFPRAAPLPAAAAVQSIRLQGGYSAAASVQTAGAAAGPITSLGTTSLGPSRMGPTTSMGPSSATYGYPQPARQVGAVPASPLMTPSVPSVPSVPWASPQLPAGQGVQQTQSRARFSAPEPGEVLPPYAPVNRPSYRALLISPGYGRRIRPAQTQLIENSGYQVQWVNVPDPETTPGWEVHLDTVKQQILQFQPHILSGASKGGHYIAALWREGFWRGSTLMINCHPSVTSLPTDMSIVITYGSNDQLYTRNPRDLQSMVTTNGTPNRCFLYYVGNAGPLPSGEFIRQGDYHDMNTLQMYDCLPRLFDAALTSNPEAHILWSYKRRLSDARLSAEQALGYTPQDLWRFWSRTNQRSTDGSQVFQVPPNSQEYALVSTIFLAQPREPPFFQGGAPFTPRILAVKRLESQWQDNASHPYYDALSESLATQGLDLEPGVHTRWAFHCSESQFSMANGDMYEGAATPSQSLQASWGRGYYFVRDAKAANDGNMCPVGPDGSKRMLMCLFMSGIPYMRDDPRGEPLYRTRSQMYNSWVDSLSNPELWGVKSVEARYPAYLITYK